MEPITALKREVDRRMVGAARGSAADRSWLNEQGFVKKPCGTGVCAQGFARWWFGGFWHPSANSSLTEVPGWMCVGWNRRQRPPLEATQAQKVALSLNEDSLQGGAERATGQWFAPFPLVVMGEGKHRVSLFAEHGLSLLVRLQMATIAPSASLRLQRVLGCTDLVALHCRAPEFWHEGQSSALLPFPALAVPLLQAYGVRWALGRHVLTPRSAELRHAAEHPWNDPTKGLERWRPRAWRSMFLSQTYA